MKKYLPHIWHVSYAPFLNYVALKTKFENFKIGQSHSKVITLANYDGLEFPMLHTKFRGNRPTGSGEDF